MEQQFKKIIQKTKAWDQGVEPLSHTFAGALFKDSAWVFSFDSSVAAESAPSLEKAVFAPVKEVAVSAPVVVKSDALSLVMFVGDTHADGKGEDLLGKMIQAMKLKPGEFTRVPFNEALDDISDLTKNLTEPTPETTHLLDQIKKHKPHVVVSLGATVTNILLGKREKLSGIHGQFFEKSLKLEEGNYSYQVMPIFHPEFLVINPNMKRTAWIDLQKVMSLIGKN